jgi:HSP20 family protein
MFEDIDSTIHSVEKLYRAVSGKEMAGEGEAAPLPPEKDAGQHLEAQLDRLLKTLGATPVTEQPRAWAPPVTVFERDGELLVSVDLPGVAREHVTVAANAMSIVITGRRSAMPDGARLSSTEAPFGAFQRHIALPPGALVADFSATMKDGVLEVRVPRTSPAARPITIQ